MKIEKRHIREAASLLLELESDDTMLKILAAEFVSNFIDASDVMKHVLLIIKNVFHYHPSPNEIRLMEKFIGARFTESELKRWNHYGPDTKTSLLVAIASEYMHRYIRRAIFL